MKNLSDKDLAQARKFHTERLIALNEEAQRRIFREEATAG